MNTTILTLVDFYEIGKKMIGETKIRQMLEEIEIEHFHRNYPTRNISLTKINYIMEILWYCFSKNEIDLMNGFLDHNKQKIQDVQIVKYLLEICIEKNDLKLLKFLISKIDINNFRKFVSNNIKYQIENVYESLYFDTGYNISKDINHPCVNEFYFFLFFYLHFNIEFLKIANDINDRINDSGERRFDICIFIINLWKYYCKKIYGTMIFGFLYGGFNSRFVGKLSVENFNNTLDLL